MTVGRIPDGECIMYQFHALTVSEGDGLLRSPVPRFLRANTEVRCTGPSFSLLCPRSSRWVSTRFSRVFPTALTQALTGFRLRGSTVRCNSIPDTCKVVGSVVIGSFRDSIRCIDSPASSGAVQSSPLLDGDGYQRYFPSSPRPSLPPPRTPD